MCEAQARDRGMVSPTTRVLYALCAGSFGRRGCWEGLAVGLVFSALRDAAVGISAPNRFLFSEELETRWARRWFC